MSERERGRERGSSVRFCWRLGSSKKKNIGPPCPLGLVKVSRSEVLSFVVGLAYQGKELVFRFIIEYSSLRDFYRPLGNKQ
jgi:hypothetical protein